MAKIIESTSQDRIEIGILSGCLFNDEFLSFYAKLHKPEYIKSRTVLELVQVCIQNYQLHQTRLSKADMQRQLAVWKAEDREESSLELSRKAIAQSALERTKNWKVLKDRAVSYVENRSLEILIENILIAKQSGKYEEAKKHILEYGITTEDGIRCTNPLVDEDLIKRAFTQKKNPLFKMKGRFGEMFNKYILPDTFIGLMAPEKRGKTWYLQEFLFAALEQHLNVAYFTIGDMGLEDMAQRVHSRNCKRPVEPLDHDLFYPCRDCVLNQNQTCVHSKSGFKGTVYSCTQQWMKEFAGGMDEFVDTYETIVQNGHVPCKKNCELREESWFYKRIDKNNVKPLSWERALARGKHYYASEEIKQMAVERGKEVGQLKMAEYPNNSCSVHDMQVRLSNWQREDAFIPDVIIVDYADLFVADRRLDYRHSQNQIWKDLRRLSQETHTCFITATQTDANSYEKELLDLTNFSEDKRKYGHVTLMMGLNQTPKQKIFQVMRVNTLLARNGKFGIQDQATCLQNLDTGQPIVFSIQDKWKPVE